MSAKKVFISYKSEDYENALWVRQVLESNGISCWMAPESIPGGSNYAVEIPQAIRGCSVFVVVVSTLCQESKWVPRELDQAINANKPIMPFMLENCELKDDFNFYLSNVQRYAAYEDKVKTIEKMILEIRSLMEVDEKLNSEAEGGESVKNEEINIIKPPKEKKEKKPKPEKAPMSAEKKSKIKKICIPVVAVILAIAVAVSAIFIVNNNKKFNPETMYRFVITASEKADVTNFEKTKEIIKKRLEAVVGKKYELNSYKTNIEVIFEKELIGKEDPEEFFKKYVMATGQIAVAENKDSAMYTYFDDEDIEKIEFKTGKLSNIDSKEIDKSKEYNYITVKFTEKAWNNSKIKDKPVMRLVVGAHADLNINSYRDKNGVYYIVEGSKENNYCKALYNILKGEKIKTDFYELYADLESLATWDEIKADKASESKQCNVDDIKDEAVLFSFELSEDTTEGDITDFTNILNKRLNIIGKSYALGKIYKDKKPCAIVVKTLPDRMNKTVTKLLTQSHGLYVRAGLQQLSLPSFGNSGYAEYKNGKLTFVFDESSYGNDVKYLKTLIKNNSKKSDYIYLNTYNENIFCAKLDENTKANPLEFTQTIYERDDNPRIKLNNQSEEDDENKWLGDLVVSIVNEKVNIPSSVRDSDKLYPSYNCDPESINEKIWNGDTDEQIVNKYKQKLKGISPDADLDFGYRTLYVELKMSFNDSFADSVPKLGKDIYNMVNFENNDDIDNINIYFIDEDNNEKERARMFFRKEYGTLSEYSDKSEGKVEVSGVFTGGKVDLVKDKIVKQLENDEFYKSREERNDIFPVTVWRTDHLFE